MVGKRIDAVIRQERWVFGEMDISGKQPIAIHAPDRHPMGERDGLDGVFKHHVARIERLRAL